jgi:hypothetical protein
MALKKEDITYRGQDSLQYTVFHRNIHKTLVAAPSDQDAHGKHVC